MSSLSAEQIQQVIDACRANLLALSDTIRAALDCHVQLTAADPVAYASDIASAGIDEPGLAVSLLVGEQGLILLIPQSLPLPSWCGVLGPESASRLEAFARKLARNLLPEDWPADGCTAVWTSDFTGVIEQAKVNPLGMRMELSASPGNSPTGETTAAKLQLILPVDAPVQASDVPPMSTAIDVETLEPADGSDLEDLEPETMIPENVSPQSRTFHGTLRALRVLRVPVTVSVRLAERKVPLGQVVTLAPGTLITFNKSCEELLDLFVNNRRYCQGEAVKIGEKFGLKVARVGVTEERPEHVL